MAKDKLIVNDLSYDEIGLLYTSLKVLIGKMTELEAPQELIDIAIPLFKEIEIVFDQKCDERTTFIELVNNELDDVAIASEIIEKNPAIEIPEYK
jgi:hypothetical protein